MANIILADTDSGFLSKLEWFFCKQSDEHDITVISSEEYLHTYFEQLRAADGLVIAEELYFPELDRQNISHIFTLTESEVEGGGTGRLDGQRISKYTTGIPEMYNIITGILKTSAPVDVSRDSGMSTTVVLVYSPVGGVGTTSAAVGLCAALYKNYKRALFLSAEGLQTFGSFFTGDHYLEDSQTAMFRATQDEALASLREMVRSELCDYLPPYESPLLSVRLGPDDYIGLIKAIRDKKTYEYIVIDCGSEFDEKANALMGEADRVVLVYDGSARSERKMNILLRSISYSEREKYIFLHNRFGAGSHTMQMERSLRSEGYAIEYLGSCEPFPQKIEEFLENKEFQELLNDIM